MEEANAPRWLVDAYLLGDLVRLRDTSTARSGEHFSEDDTRESEDAHVEEVIARGLMTRDDWIRFLTGDREQGIEVAMAAAERAHGLRGL
jgi:hypothetical protein